MHTLNAYANTQDQQVRKSLLGAGIPLDFIQDLENGSIDINIALKNVKEYCEKDSLNEFRTPEIHCALAAVHFVIAKNEKYNEEMLNEIKSDFLREMNLSLSICDFRDKSKLQEVLFDIVNKKLIF